MRTPHPGNKNSFAWLNGWLPIVLFIILMSGCAKAPLAELEQARLHVLRATEAGAENWSPGEYLLARRALDAAEQQIENRKYRSAQRTLGLAQRYADTAREETVKALQRKAEEERRLAEQLRLAEEKRQRERQQQLEAQRKLEEERRRQAAAKPVAKAAPETAVPVPPAAPAQPEKVDQYQVRAGQTLAVIAEQPEVYGDQFLWPLIYRANRDQIKIPQEVSAGQMLVIPRDKNREELEAARQEARELNLF